MMRRSVLMGLIAVCCAAAAEQGVVSGQVIDKVTGAPIPRAILSLQGIGGGGGGGRGGPGGAFGAGGGGAIEFAPQGRGVGVVDTGRPGTYSARTDADGKFRLENVAAGSYRLIGERIGYIRQQFNPRGVSTSGSQVTLKEGQQLTNLVFKLSPQGVITGRVLDEAGDPMQNVTLALLSPRFVNGARELRPDSGGSTNDIGEYRLAQIPPGKYYLMASFNMRRGMGMPEEETPYVSTYYPQAKDWAGATPVEVSEGQLLEGVDIRLARAQVYDVRGVVLDSATNAPVPNAVVTLAEQSSAARFMRGENRTARTGEDGTFRLSRVLPGAYALTSVSGGGRGGQGGRGVRAGRGGGGGNVGYERVNVGAGDVDSVVVSLRPPLEMKGTVRVEDAQSTGLPRMSILLTPESGTRRGTARLEQDGSFLVTQLAPDRYTLQFSGLPEGTYPKSARYGEADVLSRPLDLSSGVSGALAISLSTKGAEVAGVVSDSDSQPAAGVLVTLIPEGDGPKADFLYKSSRTGLDGTFRIQGLAPGSYRIYAWEDLETGNERDPDFVRRFRDFGADISVDEGETAAVQMGLIPFALVTRAQ